MKTNDLKFLTLTQAMTEGALERLSANIATLSVLIDEAEDRGRITLARLFTLERAATVTEAREKIAGVRARATALAGASRQSTRAPVGNLPLQPEVQQWQWAVTGGWKQEG